jgi:hypothetical protein
MSQAGEGEEKRLEGARPDRVPAPARALDSDSFLCWLWGLQSF